MLISWVLNNWKLIAIAALLAGTFYGGYHLRTLQYEAGERKALEERLKEIGLGTTKIIDFNSKWGETHVQDDCLNKPIPADLLRLLK